MATARQNLSPVNFQRSTRADASSMRTSARAGVVAPMAYMPVHRGDSASGTVTLQVDMAEMPRPLLNAVVCNFQAWFVPKSAHPQFTGGDEFEASYQGEPIKALGQADRTAPPFYNVVSDEPTLGVLAASDFYKTLGLHFDGATGINTDLADAMNLIYNFRLAAHSSRLARVPYVQEDADKATQLHPAFWPSGRMSRIVPDYERALIVGSLELDVLAGQVPISGLGTLASNGGNAVPPGPVKDATMKSGQSANWSNTFGTPGNEIYLNASNQGNASSILKVFAEMANQTIGITLADIDKARTTQAFAKMRTSMAGNDFTGFDNDDALMATLMQGISVDQDQSDRPWLLDNAQVPVGMVRRYALDGASLDQSVNQGTAEAELRINLPVQDKGGVIIVTCEMLPERLNEAQSDEWVQVQAVSDLPDALRDIQNPEPVDIVPNRRIDARHTSPDAIYGYEPMNDKWNRETTRLGGVFFQSDPSNPFTEQRSAIWQTSIVDPEYTSTHWLAPVPFPHDVFSDTQAPAYEVTVRHAVTLVGLTQIGDALNENNDDYENVKPEE